MSDDAVLVTGVGFVCPLGVGRSEPWAAAVAGQRAGARITGFDPSGHASQIACEIPDFDPLAFLDRKSARRMDRVSQIAVAAARIAVDDAALPLARENPRAGVMFASGAGGNATFEAQNRILVERGPERVSPFAIPESIVNMAGGHVSIALGLGGPLTCHVTACASSTHAVGEAAAAIRRGDADVIVAGGAEAGVTPFVCAGLDATRALSRNNDDPAGASRPFDIGRDGFVVGEGAAALVLESAEHARRRGADALCEVAGYAASCDAFHITEPEPEGFAQSEAMAAAIARSGRSPEDLDYVNAHGTSTPAGDPVEIRALRRAVGDDIAASVAVSSTKSMHGHCMGSAGALEAALTAVAVAEGMIPPTTNLDELDPECAGVDHVTDTGRPADLRLALSNSFGFGGHNAVVALAAR